MGNMAYCRFQNTSRDLMECVDNIDEQLGEEEHAARIRLIRTCARLLGSCGVMVDEGELEEALDEVDSWQ